MLTVMSVGFSTQRFLPLANLASSQWRGSPRSVSSNLYFRRGDFSLYDFRYWNVLPSRLPLGVAALGASFSELFALAIPSMKQSMIQGALSPSKLGIPGPKPAMVVTALCYVPLHRLEGIWRGV